MSSLMDSASAFQALKSEVKAAIKQVNAAGGEVFQRGNIPVTKKMIENAESLNDLFKQLTRLEEEWKRLLPQPTLPGVVVVKKRKSMHEVVGRKTHARYFRLPILQALVEKGDKGATKDVIDRVGEILADRLNEWDREKLRNQRTIRWRSTAAFVRLELVKEGLMNDQSPDGIWEITAAGHAYLRKHGG